MSGDFVFEENEVFRQWMSRCSLGTGLEQTNETSRRRVASLDAATPRICITQGSLAAN